jgi:hypothetical protein
MAWPVRGFDRKFAEFGHECHHENPPDPLTRRATSLRLIQQIAGYELADPVRYRPEQGAREKIPRDTVERGRDQFVCFDDSTAVGGFALLGFLDVIDGEPAQPAGFAIVRHGINRFQQIPGARAGAIVSDADHKRLLKLSAIPLETMSRGRMGRTPVGLPTKWPHMNTVQTKRRSHVRFRTEWVSFAI